MDARKGDYVRIFLFSDFRAGLKLNADKTPYINGLGKLEFTDKVIEDMQALLDSAKALGMKVMPVLLDFHMADGISDESGNWVGDFPELINDPVKRAKLVELLSGFITQFAGNDSIYAWDIMNEPENASATTIANIQALVSGIRAAVPGAKLTVGSNNRTNMLNNWTGLGLDIYQFHYYDDMAGTTPLNYAFTSAELALLGGKPVMAGELSSTDITNKLDILRQYGYAGGLFWEDTSGKPDPTGQFNLTPEEYQA